MKKGFTLLELLAVIAILSIILLFALPKILNVIENTKLGSFKKNEDMMIKATRIYLAANQGLLPAPNNSIEVSLETLKTNNYINDIKDPLDNSSCSGYIVISNLEDRTVYTPHLRCESTTITSSATDNLIAHYAFDDFQEPTVNLISYDGSFETTTGSHVGIPANSNGTYTNLGGGWSCSTHFNDGVCTIEKGGLYGNNFARWYHYATAGWRAVTSGGYSVIAGKTYTVSVWTRVNRGDYGAPSAYGFYGPVGYQYYVAWEKPPTSNINEWVRGKYTMTPDISTSGSVYLYGLSGAANGLIVDYDGLQVEEKSYATPYVNGTRTGRVSDYSTSNNYADLNLTTTPKWINQTYLFDGTNDVIQSTNTINITGNQTMSAWIKPSLTTGISGVVSLHNHTATSNLGLNISDGKLSASIGYTDATREYMTKLSNNTIPLNSWTHVVITYNSTTNKIYFYINGTLDSEHTITKTIKFTNEKITIGQWAGSYLGYNVFQGNIDEVQVHNRALNNNEIKVSYYNSKNRYN